MIDIKAWIEEFTYKVGQTFPNRVWFIGLQGSYGRDEATDTSDIDGELTVLRETENELNNKKSAILTEKAQRKRISELEAEEKDLGKKYEEAEKALYLCEKFTRVKSALLNDKINEKFIRNHIPDLHPSTLL